MGRLSCAGVLAAVILSGCTTTTKHEVTWDRQISREIPAEAALAWLRSLRSTNEPCTYHDKGIVLEPKGAVIPFHALVVVGHMQTDTTTVVNQEHFLASVAILEKNYKSFFPDRCVLHLIHTRDRQSAQQIADLQKRFDRTISALASLGVEVKN